MSVVIDDLPNEVLYLVFSRFDLLEKLRLRAVCLRWKLIIESFSIKDVSIVDSQFNQNERWYHVGLESLNCQNLIYYYSINEPNPPLYRRLTSLFGSIGPEKLSGSLQFVSQQPMFARLKSMFISLKSINDFRFETYINPHFPELEQLSCYGLTVGKTCLSLANLKVLSLCWLFRSPNTRIRLELPNMYKLVTASLNSFEFANPQTVTHLLLRVDHQSICQFSNLEYLTCHQMKHESTIFSDLAKLKEIHFTYRRENEEEKFAQIYQTKQRLGRYEVKMFTGGLEYPTYRQHPTYPIKEYYKGFLSRKCSSPVVSIIPNIRYDDLLDTLDGQAISRSLLSNIFNVRIIEGIARSSKDDVDAFFNLLNDFPNLYILNLTWPLDGPNDKQAYYDSLPSRCKFLRELELNESDDQTNLVDLRFVLNFRYLQRLKINKKPPKFIVSSLYSELKYFEILESSRKNKIKMAIENLLEWKPFGGKQ